MQEWRSLFRQRFSLLEPRARTFMTCAALLGYRFDSRLVAACCRMGEDVRDDALRRACEIGMLVFEPVRSYDFRFRHALYRSAIRDSLDERSKQRMHARIASQLALPAERANVRANR